MSPQRKEDEEEEEEEVTKEEEIDQKDSEWILKSNTHRGKVRKQTSSSRGSVDTQQLVRTRAREIQGGSQEGPAGRGAGDFLDSERGNGTA